MSLAFSRSLWYNESMENDDSMRVRIENAIRALAEKMGIEIEEISVSEAAGQTLFTVRTKDWGS